MAGQRAQQFTCVVRRRRRRRHSGEEGAGTREIGGALAIGEQAVMADAHKAVRQGVEQEAMDEFVGRKRHHLGNAAGAIVLPAETDSAVFESYEAAVGDGDPMGIAGEIGEHLLGAAERRFGKDHP